MNINFDTDVFKKILEVFSGMSAFRSIVMTLCIVFLFLFYVTQDSWSSYIDTRLNKSVSIQKVTAEQYALEPERKAQIHSILKRYVHEHTSDVAMVLVYKFVPEADNFFQYRVRVSDYTNPNLSLDLKKYNLDVLPFSALRAQIDPVMAGKIFTLSIDQMLHEYLRPDYDGRDRYLSPINYSALFQDGAKYAISVPIQNLRVIGYVSVYFKEVPSSKDELERFLSIARAISGETGYYIAY